jgi:glycosyltransferase involved in cell wall biosynthesis
MRILWVGTKPPWPATDGGRLLATVTLEALAQAGHDLTLVVPFDPARDDAFGSAQALRRLCDPILVPAPPRSRLRAGLSSIAGRAPLSVVRHTHGAVGAQVATLLAARAFDLVHAEQPQALAQCAAAFERGVPVVLRAQNVESDLWKAATRSVAALPARLEARRMARFEAEAVRRTAATIALTPRDADRLRALSGAARKVHRIPAPFPSELPPAEAPLPGAPAVVVMGSGGWLPNEQGTGWFLREVWPEVRAALPGALAHLFGEPGRDHHGPGVVAHGPLQDSRHAFARNAVLVVPLPFGSGVRMKILEAWARGVPVVATPEASLGLEADDGRELLLARTPADFTAALRLLTLEPRLAPSLVAHGREALAARHHPQEVAARLSAVYAECVARPSPRP